MLQSLRTTLISKIPLKNLESTTSSCISCRTKRRYVLPVNKVIPDERRRISQLDDLDMSSLRPQYRHVKALENAPEIVRRIYSLEFATKEEKLEAKFMQYADQLQRHKYDYDSLEMRIAELTVIIRKDQEDFVQREWTNMYLERKIQRKRKMRNDLLLQLRELNFERYCLVMKVLDLNLIHWPDYDVKLGKHARDTMDMRFRTFAETQRIENEKIKRRKEVAELQAEFEKQIKSGELVVPE